MKKTTFLFALLCSLVSFSQSKTAYINFNELVQQMPEFKAANDSALIITKEYQSQLDNIVTELKTKGEIFEKDSKSYKPEIYDYKLNEIKDLQSRVEGFKKTAETAIQKQKDELLNPIIKKAKDAVEQVAKSKGYSYVIDSGKENYVYLDPKADLMELVKKELKLN